WHEAPPQRAVPGGISDRDPVSTDPCPGPAGRRSAGPSGPRAAGQPGRRGVRPGHRAVLRQPLSADAERPGQTGHDHAAWRPVLSRRLALPGPGGVETNLTLASDMRTNGAF